MNDNSGVHVCSTTSFSTSRKSGIEHLQSNSNDKRIRPVNSNSRASSTAATPRMLSRASSTAFVSTDHNSPSPSFESHHTTDRQSNDLLLSPDDRWMALASSAFDNSKSALNLTFAYGHEKKRSSRKSLNREEINHNSGAAAATCSSTSYPATSCSSASCSSSSSSSSSSRSVSSMAIPGHAPPATNAHANPDRLLQPRQQQQRQKRTAASSQAPVTAHHQHDLSNARNQHYHQQPQQHRHTQQCQGLGIILPPTSASNNIRPMFAEVAPGGVNSGGAVSATARRTGGAAPDSPPSHHHQTQSQTQSQPKSPPTTTYTKQQLVAAAPPTNNSEHMNLEEQPNGRELLGVYDHPPSSSGPVEIPPPQQPRYNNHQRKLVANAAAATHRDSSPMLTAIEPSPPSFKPPSINGINVTNNAGATTATAGHTRTPSAPMPAMQQRQRDGAATNSNNNKTSQRQNSTRKSEVHKRRSIGEWDFVKTIGAGSMGQVKLAENRKTGEFCAVKVVPRAHADAKRHGESKKTESDESKDTRTIREAHLGRLIHHPFICDLIEVHPMTNHFYMLFEYVSGGQMLDYIISHGNLKEKQARKFARSIASALDYLHQNSIVHRDLKIENILISKTSDIKIIDFGLSNMYAPNSQLKTFCGSLYFAAPELLNATPYTGPEIDVWSFGIVLYVLVCGKVPFDDQSMPELHAKIKRGIVEYPTFISSDCKDLLSRMLVVNPQDRATLQEVIYHPWMVKGYDKPVESFVPPRRPLTLPLDPEVTKELSGFDFGSQEEIEHNLTAIIESADYQTAAAHWYKMHESDNSQSNHTPGDRKSKHFSFDFYKRRLSFGGISGDSTSSLAPDVTNAFHPLCSMYYLVVERREREARTKAEQEQKRQVASISKPDPAYSGANESHHLHRELAAPVSRARSKTQGADYAPPVAYQQQQQKQPAQERPSPPHPVPQQTRVGYHQSHASEPNAKPASTNIASNFLRRLSTRRKPVPNTTNAVQQQQQQDEPHLSRSSSMSETAPAYATVRRRPVPSQQQQQTRAQLQSDFKYPASQPTNSNGNSSSKIRTLTGSPKLPPQAQQPQQLLQPPGSPRMEPPRSPVRANQEVRMVESPQRVPSQSRNYHPSARAKSLGHSRSLSTATPGSRGVRQSMYGPKREPLSATSNQHDEFDDIALDSAPSEHSESSSSQRLEQQGMPSIEYPKQVFLKGFFSVQSTSTKPLSFIRSDIIRVLNHLGVEFKEIKGGFLCRHRASIKGSDDDDSQQHYAAMSPPMSPVNASTQGHWRKLSFGSGLFSSSTRRRNMYGESTGNIFDSDISTESMGGHLGVVGNSDMLGPHHQQHSASSTGVAAARTPVQFEINIVKVPLFSLHGVQFKKLMGNSWQYKNLATKILGELKL